MFIKPNNFRYADGKTNFDIKMDLMWIDSLTWDSYAYSLIMRKKMQFPRYRGPKCQRGAKPSGRERREACSEGITAGDPVNLRRYQPTCSGISPLIHSELSKWVPAPAQKCSGGAETLTKREEVPTAWP